MKINLGCGADYRQGWLNIDRYESTRADLIFNLEQTPWPLETSGAEVVLLKHVLQQLGSRTDRFLAIICELYRISKPNGLVEIHVPHPRHDDFLGDPAQVRPILPETLRCFDLALVEEWQAAGSPVSALAKYIGVDFETIHVEYFLDPYWMDLRVKGEIDDQSLARQVRSSANVIQWIKIVLQARKPFAPGRSLQKYGAICLHRNGGLGDVLMALGCAKALHLITRKPIFLNTNEIYKSVAATSPFLTGIVTNQEQFAALDDRFAKEGGVRHAHLNPITFGLAGTHQIDAYLAEFGLRATAEMKDIVLDVTLGQAEAENFLRDLPELAPGQARVLVHPIGMDVNRSWPREKWEALAQRLSDSGAQVIAIGRSTVEFGRLASPSVHNAIDALSLAGTLALMAVSDVLIATDSGPVQLAAATGIHIIGIYSVVRGKNRLPFRRGSAEWRNIAVEPDCVFKPCYDKFWEELKKDITAGVKSKLVAEQLQGWCLNSDYLVCLRKEISVDKVFGAYLSTRPASQIPPDVLAR